MKKKTQHQTHNPFTTGLSYVYYKARLMTICHLDLTDNFKCHACANKR